MPVDSTNLFVINQERALYTANLFWDVKNEENYDSKKSSSIKLKIADKINELKDDENQTVFYVINYKDNKGFTIVSSDKRMIPILAYSEEGNFSEKTDNPGIQFWCNLIKNTFKDTKKI